MATPLLLLALAADWMWNVRATAAFDAPAAVVDEATSRRLAYSRDPADWPEAHWDESIPPDQRHELGLLPSLGDLPTPAERGNPKIDLGRKLFFEPRLSGSGHVSCISCHHPDTAWADPRRVSHGHGLQTGERNAPSLMNVAHGKRFMWDGRAESLEAQVLLPLAAGNEMAADIEAVPERLKQAGYAPLFDEAFGNGEISTNRVAEALAAFQRTIVGGRSRFDSFLKGSHDALTDQQLRGLHLFRTKGRCINCHNGPNFTDEQFHDLGLSYYGRKFEDLGRYEVTKRPEDVGKFKTPSLRNVTNTAPYMHNGLFELEGVLNMYSAGMPTLKRKADQQDDPLFPTKSPLLHELDLSDAEKADLIAFLEALAEPKRTIRPPELPNSP